MKKENAIQFNEQKYGKEIRAQYGNEAAETSYQKMMKMNDEDFVDFQTLSKVILERLEAAVAQKCPADSEEAKQIALLHQAWLKKVMPQYNRQIHHGLAQMYIEDERFTAFYDKEQQGCAELLKNAILYWI